MKLRHVQVPVVQEKSIDIIGQFVGEMADDGMNSMKENGAREEIGASVAVDNGILFVRALIEILTFQSCQSRGDLAQDLPIEKDQCRTGAEVVELCRQEFIDQSNVLQSCRRRSRQLIQSVEENVEEVVHRFAERMQSVLNRAEEKVNQTNNMPSVLLEQTDVQGGHRWIDDDQVTNKIVA